MASEPVARSESFTVFIPEFERLISEVIEEWRVPGLAVAVVQDGDAAFVRPYGLRDVEAGLKVTTDTQFQLMSVSKSFTATGLALLVDERRMDWKKPVREYIPEFRLRDAVASDRVTVRDLLCHHSGLPRQDRSGQQLNPHHGDGRTIRNNDKLRPGLLLKESRNEPQTERIHSCRRLVGVRLQPSDQVL
jgi:CubicO group peptidase (beta-lactamase class C family)